MKYMKYIITMTVMFMAFACGDPEVNFDDVTYQPKIVVESIISPGEKMDGILLMRNFAIETNVDSNEVYLDPDLNNVTASINGKALLYDDITRSYYLDENAAYDADYTLQVSAVIDDELLECSSTTHTPSPGFELVENNLGTLQYRVDEVVFHYYPSPGTDTYAFSIRPEGATLDNFIYDNPYFSIERDDLEDDFNDYLYEYNMVINVNSYSTDPIEYEVIGFDTWFYTPYTLIAYAADKNYKDYLITADNVQEPDGNFIQPTFHFEGDGIGIFGSAIRDTLRFELVK